MLVGPEFSEVPGIAMIGTSSAEIDRELVVLLIVSRSLDDAKALEAIDLGLKPVNVDAIPFHHTW
jgi:hypothetical protein